MSQQQHIFISYSRRDTEIMMTLHQFLLKSGFRVWTDENLVAGTPSWKNEIERAIQNSFSIVVLMSPASKKSEWVERELDYAYMLKRRIFPVLVDGIPQTAIPFELINIQYVDLRFDFDDKVLHLVSGLKAFSGKQLTPHVQETNPLEADNIDALVEERVHQIIMTFPEELQERINISDKGEVDIIINEVETEIEMPDLPMPIASLDEASHSEKEIVQRLVSNLKLMSWYFLAPQKLSRFQNIFLSKAPARINAIMTTTLFILLVCIPTMLINWFLSLIFLFNGFILLLVAFAIVTYGNPQNSYKSYLWSVGKGIIIITLIFSIVAIVGAVGSFIYYIY